VLPEAMSTTDEVVVEEKKVARGPVFKAAQKLKKYVEGALWTLKWMFDDLMWGLKLPMEIIHCLQNEIVDTLKDNSTMLDYMGRREMKANYLSELYADLTLGAG